MTGFSRRGFMKVAGVGVASGVGAAALPGVSAVAAAPAAAAVVPTKSAHPTATGSLVAHVKDLSASKISLLVGSSEFHVTDPALVAALAKAVESARRS